MMVSYVYSLYRDCKRAASFRKRIDGLSRQGLFTPDGHEDHYWIPFHQIKHQDHFNAIILDICAKDRLVSHELGLVLTGARAAVTCSLQCCVLIIKVAAVPM
jgi:hypothetical protein